METFDPCVSVLKPHQLFYPASVSAVFSATCRAVCGLKNPMFVQKLLNKNLSIFDVNKADKRSFSCSETE